MQDDFSALDLLSCGGFRLSACSGEAPPSSAMPQLRHKEWGHQANWLGRFSRSSLLGWPVPLSWPTEEVAGER